MSNKDKFKNELRENLLSNMKKIEKLSDAKKIKEGSAKAVADAVVDKIIDYLENNMKVMVEKKKIKEIVEGTVLIGSEEVGELKWKN